MSDPPDFSSEQYWSDRFKEEKSFEWLLTPRDLIPIVQGVFSDHVNSMTSANGVGSSTAETGSHHVTPRRYGILHLGCGTSNLGQDIRDALRSQRGSSTGEPTDTAPFDIQVMDTDYVCPLHRNSSVSFVQSDLLDVKSVRRVSPDGQPWDMIVDKSTADAISCGHSITTTIASTGAEYKVEPIIILSQNLAKVVRKGAKWICVSYSQTRFDFLSSEPGPEGNGWRLVDRIAVNDTPKERIIRDESRGTERVVYEPATPTWVYILERV